MASLVFYLDDGSTFTHEIEGHTTTVGRHPDSVVVLEFPSVSGRHAAVEQREDGFYVVDYKPSNGTRVNGVEVEEAKLTNGDRVGFGEMQAVFYEHGAPTIEDMPPPDAVVEAPPPAAPPANYRPAPPRRSPVRRHVPKGYPESGGGCGTAFLVILLFIGALVTGLYIRHHQETNGGNFFSDVYQRLSGKLPQIKIENKSK